MRRIGFAPEPTTMKIRTTKRLIQPCHKPIVFARVPDGMPIQSSRPNTAASNPPIILRQPSKMRSETRTYPPARAQHYRMLPRLQAVLVGRQSPSDGSERSREQKGFLQALVGVHPVRAGWLQRKIIEDAGPIRITGCVTPGTPS
jgi:hypothetical protein